MEDEEEEIATAIQSSTAMQAMGQDKCFFPVNEEEDKEEKRWIRRRRGKWWRKRRR